MRDANGHSRGLALHIPFIQVFFQEQECTMQIELLGCTSTGKSTLARHAVEAARQQRKRVVMGDDFVLQRFGFGYVRGRWARMFLLDSLALCASIRRWPKYRKFFRFALWVILRAPMSSFQKLNAVRNILKKVGIYEIIRRDGYDQIVLVDEGTIGEAHGLFVHVAGEPSLPDVEAFASLVPLPDVAVHVRERESLIVERTMARGHKRIPAYSRKDASMFVNHAVRMFDELRRCLDGMTHWFLVESGCAILTDQAWFLHSELDLVSGIIQTGLEKVNSADSVQSSPTHDRTITKCRKLLSLN